MTSLTGMTAKVQKTSTILTWNDVEYEKRANIKEAELRPFLTDEFLDILVLSAKTCGHSVDHIETVNFIYWCFDIAGKEKPSIEAYDYNKEEL